MFSESTLTTIRTILFGTAGLVCAAYAVSALVGDARLPDWLPPAIPLTVAAVFFLASLIAGQASAEASLDESYALTNKNAASAGFWGALIIGSAQWIAGIGAPFELAITLSGASAVYFLAHVLAEIRGRA